MSRLTGHLKWLKKHKAQVEWQRLLASEKERLTAARYHRERKKKDPAFRLLGNLRSRVRLAVKEQNIAKWFSTMTLVGCSISELRQHLEKQFKPGMSWANYGEWHIDHIKPCSKFNLLDPDEQRACFHFTNLQPLWADDNFRKNDDCVDDF